MTISIFFFLNIEPYYYIFRIWYVLAREISKYQIFSKNLILSAGIFGTLLKK